MNATWSYLFDFSSADVGLALTAICKLMNLCWYENTDLSCVFSGFEVHHIRSTHDVSSLTTTNLQEELLRLLLAPELQSALKRYSTHWFGISAAPAASQVHGPLLAHVFHGYYLSCCEVFQHNSWQNTHVFCSLSILVQVFPECISHRNQVVHQDCSDSCVWCSLHCCLPDEPAEVCVSWCASLYACDLVLVCYVTCFVSTMQPGDHVGSSNYIFLFVLGWDLFGRCHSNVGTSCGLQYHTQHSC